jgi:hypothetical protein
MCPPTACRHRFAPGPRAVNSGRSTRRLRILDTSVETETGGAGGERDASMQVRVVAGTIAVGPVLFLVRLLGAPWPHFPLTFPDSFSYLKVARIGPFHPVFYFTERPIGFPLLAWVVGRSPTLIVVAQSILYVVAFVVLGRVLMRSLSSRVVALVTILFVVALAIESRNAQWNTLVLSESLSNSAAVLTIAAWLHAASRPSRRVIRLAWLATVAWVLVRDANVLTTMVCVVPSALALGYAARRFVRPLARTLVVGGAALTLVCGYVYVSQNVSNRNVYPVFNNVGTRILPDPGLTKWFGARGMPINAAVLGRTGHVTWDDNSAFLDDPQLAGMRSWAKGPGGRILVESLVLRAPDWWHRLHAELPRALASPDAEYDNFHVEQRLPRKLPAPFGEPRTTGGLTAGLALAVAGIGVTAFDRRRRLLAVFAAVLLTSALVDLYISFAGDSVEVERHLVGPLLRLALMIVISVALGADTALKFLRDRRAAAPRTDAGG